MGWVQGPMLKCPDRHPDDPDEHFAVVRVTGDRAETVGYSAENPLDVVKELEAHLNLDGGQA